MMGLSGVMVMFSVLIGVLVTQVYAFAKTQNTHVNRVHFIGSKFSLKDKIIHKY